MPHTWHIRHIFAPFSHSHAHEHIRKVSKSNLNMSWPLATGNMCSVCVCVCISRILLIYFWGKCSSPHVIYIFRRFVRVGRLLSPPDSRLPVGNDSNQKRNGWRGMPTNKKKRKDWETTWALDIGQVDVIAVFNLNYERNAANANSNIYIDVSSITFTLHRKEWIENRLCRCVWAVFCRVLSLHFYK